MGRAARGVGADIAPVPKRLAQIDDSLGGAHLQPYATHRSLSSVVEDWTRFTKRLTEVTVTTGDKLLETVDISVTTDNEGGNLFVYVRSPEAR